MAGRSPQLADLDNAGTIDLAAGTLDVAGNYTQEVSGTYGVGVGGLAAGTEFGQLNVNGLATLDGVLTTSLIDSFARRSGASTQYSHSDRFPVTSRPNSTSNSKMRAGFTPSFNPNTNPTELDLEVVAESPGTQTTLRSSENPSNYSDLVSFTVYVTPLAPTSPNPGGTVTFYDGGTALDTEMLVDGSASFTTSALLAGPNPIVAQYNGDAEFQPKQLDGPSPVRQPGRQLDRCHVVSRSLDRQPVGDVHGDRFPVAPATGTPTGTVTFYDGTTAIDTETLSGGSASYTTSTLAGRQPRYHRRLWRRYQFHQQSRRPTSPKP